MSELTGLWLALGGAYGVYLLYTAVHFGWRGIFVAPGVTGPVHRRRWRRRLALDDVRLRDVFTLAGLLFVVAGGAAYAVFGGTAVPLLAGCFGATFPLTATRTRRRRQQAAAREAWPRMIEELRLLTTSVGRSVPQALFDVGRRGPVQLRPAFEAAHREWLLSTDFDTTLLVLKSHLADATADVVCETLLVAHEMGGTDIDRRLAALADDRTRDLQGRKDAAAKQAGARFARAFVIAVPVGMALVGLTIGNGRTAYASQAGQAAVIAAMVMIAGCWWWAGWLMQLPTEQRVFFPTDERQRFNPRSGR